MNTRIINLNQYTIIINWKDDYNAYVTYHKNGEQIKEWQSIDSYHQSLIIAVVGAACYSLNLNLWSY